MSEEIDLDSEEWILGDNFIRAIVNLDWKEARRMFIEADGQINMNLHNHCLRGMVMSNRTNQFELMMSMGADPNDRGFPSLTSARDSAADLIRSKNLSTDSRLVMLLNGDLELRPPLDIMDDLIESGPIREACHHCGHSKVVMHDEEKFRQKFLHRKPRSP